MTETGMNETDSVIDRKGTRGTLDLAAVPPDGKDSPHVLVRLANGSNVFVPSDMLVGLKEGGYFFPHNFDDLQNQAATSQAESQAATQDAANQEVRNQDVISQAAISDNMLDERRGASGANSDSVRGAILNTTNSQMIVPVLAEQLQIERRRVTRGGVRLVKSVSERTETVDVPLVTEQVEVERIPINKMVDSAPPIRYEGDVMIVPLLEEVLVVEKRLMLKEEIRIVKRQQQTSQSQEVVLRTEEVSVERFDAPHNNQMAEVES